MASAPELGLFLAPNASGYPEVVRQVGVAEREGLDLIGIQDHPYQRRFLDTFVLIADLLARTERLRFFPDVASLPLRPPAMLAKLAASLDVMSGGRFELGLGAGAFWDPIAAMGGPVRSPGESVEALEEAIAILRQAFSGQDSITFEGGHYSLDGFRPGPPPAHDIGLWIGAYKPRMLGLTGRLGDGWLPSLGYAGPDAIPKMRARVDEAAEKADRDPGEIRGIYNIKGTITDGPAGDLLDGPPDHWIETLTEFTVELGFDAFILAPAEDEPDQIERFAREVAPGVRAAVAS